MPHFMYDFMYTYVRFYVRFYVHFRSRSFAIGTPIGQQILNPFVECIFEEKKNEVIDFWNIYICIYHTYLYIKYIYILYISIYSLTREYKLLIENK